MQTLYLVDGSSILFRAFYAVRRLSTRDGRPTNAIFGTLKIAEKLLKDLDPKHVAFVFDTPVPTFRHKAYAAYKANRPEMAPAMASQIEPAKAILKAMGVPVLEMEGYEADDIIGTLAREALSRDMETVIVTADKDFYQLVRPGVTIIQPKNMDAVLDGAEVEKVFGVPPERVVDVLSLWGDSSDNIPGVPGIGEKGAKDLVRRFGGLEEVIAHAGDVSRKSYREGLLAHAETARLSRELATIKTDVPLPWSPDALELGHPEEDNLRELYREYEFTSLLPRGRETEPETLSVECRPLDQGGGSLLQSARTVGLAWEDRTLFLSDGSTAWSLPSGELAPELLAGLPLCAHDLKPLLRRLDPWTFVPGERFLDSAVAGYLLDPAEAVPSLPSLARRFLNLELKEGDGAARAAALARLGPGLGDAVGEAGMGALYAEIERPLVSILARMESKGVVVDVPYLEELGRRMAAEVEAVEAGIFEAVGSRFNVASSKQVGEILFEKLGLPVKKRTAKTKSYSTNVKVLQALRNAHPVVPLILEHRMLSKLRGTYVESLPKWVDAATGRVHAVFNQTATATGRLSSLNPNLQNIPARGEWGPRIRKSFVAGEGCLFVGADYSQIELRILAHLSGDPSLKAIFERGEDIHTSTASEVFNVSPDFVTPDMRRQAKAVNFGILYGMAPFGLAAELGVTQREAKAFIERYFDRFPAVLEYIRGVEKTVLETEEVRTLLGRRRLFPSIASARGSMRSNLLRQAVNTTVQGSAADLIKKAMVAVDARLPEGSAMVLQIHDELVAEAPVGEAEETARALKEAMESALSLSVPLVAESRTGRRWSDLK